MIAFSPSTSKMIIYRSYLTEAKKRMKTTTTARFLLLQFLQTRLIRSVLVSQTKIISSNRRRTRGRKRKWGRRIKRRRRKRRRRRNDCNQTKIATRLKNKKDHRKSVWMKNRKKTWKLKIKHKKYIVFHRSHFQRKNLFIWHLQLDIACGKTNGRSLIRVILWISTSRKLSFKAVSWNWSLSGWEEIF